MSKITSDGVMDIPESRLDPIPASQGFVPESTLIPESNFQSIQSEMSRGTVSGESVTMVHETTSSAAASSEATATASALKKNVPFLVLGGVVALGALALMFKPAPPAPQPKAEPVVAVAPANNNAKELRERDQRISELAGQLTSVQAQATAAAEEAAQLRTALAAAQEREATTTGRLNALLAAQAAEAKSVSFISPKLAKSLKPAPGYTVNVARNGLAWVSGPNGVEVVKVGDEIASLGPVLRIDEISWQVQAGKNVISAADR